MPLILAIEPDRNQATQLTSMVRGRLRAELVLAAGAESALAQLGDRIPDLILTSALLSPKDEAALADRLRDWDEAAAHVQTLTIPVLDTPVPRSASGRGVLFALMGERVSSPAAPDGCDPAVFAEQCAAYLERAASEREHDEHHPYVETVAVPPPVRVAVEAVESPYVPVAVAAVEPPPAPVAVAYVEPSPAPVVVEAEPEVVSIEPEPPIPVFEPMPAFQPRPAFEPMPLVANLAPPPAEPELMFTPMLAAEFMVPFAAAPVAPIADLPLAPVANVEFHAEMDAVPTMDESVAMATPATIEAPPIQEEETAYVAPPTPPMAPPTASMAPPPPVAAPIREEVEIDLSSMLDENFVRQLSAAIETVSRDSIRLTSEASNEDTWTPSSIGAAAAWPGMDHLSIDVSQAHSSPASQTSHGSRPFPERKPIQDEWGFFDPAQCGFAALLAKLDEITSVASSLPALDASAGPPDVSH